MGELQAAYLAVALALDDDERRGEAHHLELCGHLGCGPGLAGQLGWYAAHASPLASALNALAVSPFLGLR
jgi:hypothetical protein